MTIIPVFLGWTSIIHAQINIILGPSQLFLVQAR